MILKKTKTRTFQLSSEIFHLVTYSLKHINHKFLKTTFENSDVWVIWGSTSVVYLFFLLTEFIGASDKSLTEQLHWLWVVLSLVERVHCMLWEAESIQAGHPDAAWSRAHSR